MLELVVERGINDAPMAELARRSGASTGIIYHYFSNKDDIINQLYLSIKARMVESLIADLVSDMPVKKAFLQVWKNAYTFYRSHPRETKFLSQYENLPCYEKSGRSTLTSDNPNYHLLVSLFRPKKDGGLLKDLPFEVSAELTVGLAARLAKQPEVYPVELLNRVAEICWRAVLEDIDSED